MRQTTSYVQRAVHYLADRLASHYNDLARAAVAHSGRIDRNSSLIPVHSMNIISFNLFHGPHPLTRLRLLDPDTDRRLVPEPLTLGFFESGGLSDCRPVISS